MKLVAQLPPKGAGSTVAGLSLHLVVHVSLDDVRARAAWAGGRFPTEVEWECSARLGLIDPAYPESGMHAPDGSPRANVWAGLFPVVDLGQHGFAGSRPSDALSRVSRGPTT